MEMTTMRFSSLFVCLVMMWNVSATCNVTENLNSCLTNLSSVLEHNLNSVYRLKQMCMHENRRNTVCVIEGLQQCPKHLNETDKNYLTFLREITVDDLNRSCAIWDGIDADVRSSIERVYVSKMAIVCVQMGPTYLELNGSRNVCSYLNQRNRCALENLQRDYPQHVETYKSMEAAAMMFTHCVDHTKYSISEVKMGSVNPACTVTENLNTCLTSLSSVLENNRNSVHRLKRMCRHANQRHIVCSIEGLQKCPKHLNDTAEDFLTFLREITVDDLQKACAIWDGIDAKVRSSIERVYVSKMTNDCIQKGPKRLDLDGKRNVCSYLNRRNRCALENLQRDYPEYVETYKSMETAAMLFTHCVNHSKHRISEVIVPLSVSSACTVTENLDTCLANLSSILKYNLNSVYRIKQMCSHENQRHTHCAIEGLQRCPSNLNDTAEDFLTFLREITVDDLNTACTIWDGTDAEAKSVIEKVYVSKMTMICIQIGRKYFDLDGRLNVCSYLNQNNRCALENLQRTYPQYVETYKSIERAAMLFTHCVDHDNYSISEADGIEDDADMQRGEDDDEVKKEEEELKEDKKMPETSDTDQSKLNGSEWCATSENLDNSLVSISSVIQYNYNMVTRIRDMCRQENQRHAVCAIEGLQKYPERLNDTAQVFLTFLREISVDDVNRVCSVWDGIDEEAKSVIGKIYVAKITSICVQMRRKPIDPNGGPNMCGYLNLNNRCAQEKLESSHPQYLESYKAMEEAAMKFTHCVEHKRADVDVVPSKVSPNEADGGLGGEGDKDSQEEKEDISSTFISLLMSGATAVASLMGWPAEKEIG